jgi:hypothetical protein
MQASSSLNAADNTLRAELGLRHKKKIARNNSIDRESEMSVGPIDKDAYYADVKPAKFINSVLKNCGVIREKSTNVIETERASGFMRKIPSIKT